MSDPFENEVERYEAWYEEHPRLFAQELDLLRTYWPTRGRRLELGSGTGRFGAALGVEVGCEPAAAMNTLGVRRLPAVVRAVGEELPFGDAVFDAALAVGVLGFVAGPARVMEELHRVLAPRGLLLLAFIDAAGPLGRRYAEAAADGDPFYSRARFHTAAELEELTLAAGFSAPFFAQTLLGPPRRPLAIPGCAQGSGRGGFSCLVSRKTA